MRTTRLISATVVVLGVVVWATIDRAALAQTVVFQDGFDSGLASWTLWADSKWVPRADCPGLSNCWGPLDSFFPIDGDHSHYYPDIGNNSVRQVIGQPWWSGRWHEEVSLAGQFDKTITASIWQFEDYGHQAPFTPPVSHDQDQGWLVLMSADGSDYFALGVHAHEFSPAPLLDWWGHLSWGTAADGWHTTTYPRSQGWRRLKIVVHPYTGQGGEVEFYAAPDPGVGNPPQFVLLGTGQRRPGDTCRGVPITRIGMGANPALIPEDYIANTYEWFWYDDALLTIESPTSLPCANPQLRFDADNDGDVDQEDFAVFQACYTGAGGTFACPACKCMNANTDAAIDADDLAAFEACASGPGVPADITCDDALPPP